jgi:hypothetical protein
MKGGRKKYRRSISPCLSSWPNCSQYRLLSDEIFNGFTAVVGLCILKEISDRISEFLDFVHRPVF